MYKDTIKWYLNKNNFNSCTYQFFTRVIGCSDVNTNYDTLDELNSYPLSKSQQEFPVYSVEFNEEGRLVLSVDFYAGRFVPTSIALISLDSSGNPFMIAKIVTNDNEGSSSVSASISRIFDIPIPKFELGGTYHYPSFETVYKRKSGTPIGEEKVMIGEHHHAVRTGDTNDTYPSLYSGQDNFIMGAQNALPSEIKESKSYVFGERGTLVPNYTDLLGVKATQNSINITDRNSASIMADILADVLEVIIMANNKIQILGKSIPDYGKVIPVSDEKQYILMANSIDQSNERKLEAIDTERLKSWILGKLSVGSKGSTVVLTSTISVIKSDKDFTISPNGSNKLAIVANTNPVVSTGNKSNLKDKDIEVTLTGVTPVTPSLKLKIHASSIKYFYFDGSTWEEYYDTFAFDTLSHILAGNFKFDKLDVADKITSTNLTVNGTSRLNLITKLNDDDTNSVITLSNSKLKFGDSFISSDSSASFGTTTKTTINTEGKITAVKLKSTDSELTSIEQIDSQGITLKSGSVLKFHNSSINGTDGSVSLIDGKTTINASGDLSTEVLTADSIGERTSGQGILLNNKSKIKFGDSYISGVGSAGFNNDTTQIKSSGDIETSNLKSTNKVEVAKISAIGKNDVTLTGKFNFGTSYLDSTDGSMAFNKVVTENEDKTTSTSYGFYIGNNTDTKNLSRVYVDFSNEGILKADNIKFNTLDRIEEGTEVTFYSTTTAVSIDEFASS